MRDLTKAELDEYFWFALTDTMTSFDREQAILVRDAVEDSGMMDALRTTLAERMRDTQRTHHDAILAFWVSAFQMGRECESRLLTAALKGKAMKP